MFKNTHEDTYSEAAILPKDTSGSAQTGRAVRIADYRKARICILSGAWAGGTAAVTVEQGKGVAMNDNKPLAFTIVEKKVAGAEKFVQTAVTANTFNISAANTLHIIELDSDMLDAGFDSIQLKTATPGANADLITAWYELSGSRYNAEVLPNPNA